MTPVEPGQYRRDPLGTFKVIRAARTADDRADSEWIVRSVHKYATEMSASEYYVAAWPLVGPAKGAKP